MLTRRIGLLRCSELIFNMVTRVRAQTVWLSPLTLGVYLLNPPYSHKARYQAWRNKHEPPVELKKNTYSSATLEQLTLTLSGFKILDTTTLRIQN